MLVGSWGRVETTVQSIGVHVVADHALAEKVESGIRGMREFDRCLNAETVGIIKTLSDGGWPHPKKEISRNEEAYTRIRPPLRER